MFIINNTRVPDEAVRPVLYKAAEAVGVSPDDPILVRVTKGRRRGYSSGYANEQKRWYFNYEPGWVNDRINIPRNKTSCTITTFL